MSAASIIIVSYYTGPALWLAVGAALKEPECCEVILVDNGNIPGDEARLAAMKETHSRLRILTGHGNIGFAKGCNLGARSATGAYLLFLNPDSMLPEGGLSRALGTMRQYPETTLAGCHLVNPDGSEQRGGRRALLTPENAVVESLGLHLFFKRFKRLNYHKTEMPAAPHEVPAISGAFMLIARSFYQRLGGLDEGYFLHMEDMDFCYRVTKAGGRIICLPDVKVLHFRGTSEVPSAFIERQKAKGFIRYLHRHFSDRSKMMMWGLTIGIWLRYVLKRFTGAVNRVFEPPLPGRREVARLALLYRLTRFAPQDHSLADQTIVVTGASGQVGLCVIGKALARGARVIAVFNKTAIPFSHPNLTWLRMDLANPPEVPVGLNAGVLIHTAGLWLLPGILPQLFNAGLRRVVAFSSTSVLSKIDSHNAHEQEVVAKLAKAEEEVLKLSADQVRQATILRPTMIYGAGLDRNITQLADVIRRFGFIPVHDPASGSRHPVQAEDLAEAALAVLDKPQTFGKTYNLGGRQRMTYRDMLIFIFQYLGKKPRLVNIPALPKLLDALGFLYQFNHINGEMARRMNRDLLFDIRDAIADFGYRPRAFLHGEVTI